VRIDRRGIGGELDDLGFLDGENQAGRLGDALKGNYSKEMKMQKK
jgi:hypothetical protein